MAIKQEDIDNLLTFLEFNLLEDLPSRAIDTLNTIIAENNRLTTLEHENEVIIKSQDSIINDYGKQINKLKHDMKSYMNMGSELATENVAMEKEIKRQTIFKNNLNTLACDRLDEVLELRANNEAMEKDLKEIEVLTDMVYELEFDYGNMKEAHRIAAKYKDK